SGKTTLISRVFAELRRQNLVSATGFLTEEVREDCERRSRRIGFDVVLLEHPETRAPLARCADVLTSIVPRSPKVGQYVVNVQSFEQLAVPCIQSVLEKLDSSPNSANQKPVICIIDEIGKMELLCPTFSNRLEKLLTRIDQSENVILLATVPSPRGSNDSRRGIRLVDELCGHPRARLFEVSSDFAANPVIEFY
ncbi:Nucleoside-triphosphatase, partial [Fasciolopsis buskii]